VPLKGSFANVKQPAGSSWIITIIHETLWKMLGDSAARGKCVVVICRFSIADRFSSHRRLLVEIVQLIACQNPCGALG
jgi:hypothetical protein